nr:immunoglobulin light chain junction region [Macaca mulatta]
DYYCQSYDSITYVI